MRAGSELRVGAAGCSGSPKMGDEQSLGCKKLAAEPDHTDVTLPAVERVRALSKMGYNIEINEDIAPRRYFRSGVEMERMAAVYLEEGSLENAFVLYNKFITLFVEKLPSHRDYQQCNVPEKQVIMKKLQEVAFPRKDQLKRLLHEKYSKEHSEYLKSQTQAMAVDMCSERLQKMSLLEEERQRVAQLRKMQIESEQFRYFEDQLHRQELASHRDEAVPKLPEQTDGSCLSQTPRNHVRLDPNRNKPAASVPKPAATLAAVQNQRVEGLRRVLIPRDLTYRFLLLADSNTARGIETCGVLYSFVPEIADPFLKSNLFWGAFLSSVDLHTHSSYQLMLPEAIAIVCAPKHNDTGVFRLTSAGMGEVAGCRLKGFHPHSKDPPLFTICKHIVVKDSKTTVLDLR
uniref:AMSH-like protease n=1 Tax=Sinocyclocheilus rhinocerous TaxID=307959 RepID=A0A673K1G2_9TELE